jgi:orotidine-5'-phosphate decarboxylase
MIYLALDFPTWDDTNTFLEENELQGVPVKVGMELFYREGPAVIEKLKARSHPIFLDLKLHDIPNTVRQAMQNIAKLEVDMVNVHASGGSEMIQWAKDGLINGNPNYATKLIAVTILTSIDEVMMNKELLWQGAVREKVVYLANLARSNGADGVVCSVHEALQVKEVCGEDFLTVTPGIRLASSMTHDQKRIATPGFAKENGVDILVIGRSITKAENPKAAYQIAVEEWENGIKG